ncbi:hypothetical protein Ga0466249_005247 [Sporomusaceae bacterium BoRhaA]|uniref:hypothetical protein n=1 Tax=Pelorhabdus rhamnosifermentans TaxID=2772457 RepID=UPI001C064407|nr:hypothetical protein [Pelorhabdus rhamnosifermentans]MBU2704094.1 hypothetical protein [Pelorhabdus rhamnosifermentans]
MKSSEICAALRDRYKQPEWALFFEVGSGTGANCRRHADALAMNMYPSRGLSIVGFEIKVSRGDLKRELENPVKAEEIARFCNEWFLAVPEGLIKDDDLIPAAWGVIECKDGRIWINKKAEQLKPQPITKQFMAAVLRAAGKVDEETFHAAINQERNECYKQYEENLKSQVEMQTKRLRETLKNYEQFEQLTGEKIGAYADVEGLAERWKLATNIKQLYGKYDGIKAVLRQAERFVDSTKKIIGEETTQTKEA